MSRRGSLPRPFLSALPGLIVEPGTHVTLQCRRPPPTFPSAVTFSLLKDGTPLPLYKQNSVGTSADFALFSVRAQDVGNYSCAYYVKMAPYQLSESSDVLEIWVTDALSKPSLSAWPVSEVTSGANVTLVCQGPSWATGFLLFKLGNEKILLSMRTSEDGTQFFLTHVTPNHSGNYICSYQLSLNGRSWSLNSDPLQLIVRGSMPCNILIITLSCISFFFLLCVLLRIFLCQESIPPWCLQGDSPRR
ncbi:immunoglobulin superfamily member 1-like [Macrotis lagotis]|uniref:immunoglobulin superfamily member 1-like n=1 Tax=Macrotis lagotis TaxID=92651 RepID=UPI003D699B47